MFTAQYKSKSTITVALIITGVILLNFVLARPLNYPLTIAPIIVLSLSSLMLSLKRGYLRFFILWIFVIAYVLIKSTWDLLSISDTQTQFFKTFMLWLFYWTCFLALIIFPVKPRIRLSKLSKTYSFLFLLIFTTCIAQLIYYKISGDISVFNLWGDRSYADQGYVTKVIEFGALKTTAFYFEPAFCALVMYALLTARQLSSKVNYIYFPGILAAFYITGSFSGVICALLVLLTTVIFPDNSSKKTKALKIGIGAIVFTFAFYFLADLITTRSMQVFDSSTSTYYRLIAPLAILRDVLIDHPLGMLFGVMESDLLRYSLSNGTAAGKTIDNGWYLLIYYFGWVGIITFIFCLVLGLYYSLKHRKGSIEAYQFLLLSPFFTGAVFSPEFLFLQTLVILTYKQRQLQ